MPLRDYRMLLSAPLLLLPGLTAVPQTAVAQAASTSPTAGDVATTPLRDINVKKTKIPAVLESAAAAPYTLAGLDSCRRIAAQVGQLNEALGEDFDVQHAQGHSITAGRLAQSVVESFIPFGGIIKEVSGANAEQRRFQAAVAAGFARRGFLKGVGLSRHCPAPARPV